jgi:hypothetical protein
MRQAGEIIRNRQGGKWPEAAWRSDTTHSHAVLSQLESERQYEELSKSRAILKEQLGVDADVLAYPVGHKDSFSEQTQKMAR